MAGIENVQAVSDLDNPNRYGGMPDEPEQPEKPKKKADTREMRDIHARLMNWYENERQLQAFNRYQMAIDEDFFDGLQWSDEDAQALQERGQAPLVYNHIKPTINWLLGTERRTRTDGVVLPREADDEAGAEVKSKLLKYLSDVNKLPYARSRAWEDCVIAGVGWLEDTISTDPTQELLQTRSESWRNIWYDSQSIEKDINLDARYLFRRRDVDLDYAQALCPEYKDEMKAMAVDAEQLAHDDAADFYLGARTNSELNGDYATPSRRATSPFSASASVELRRERVRLIECWYKMPENVKLLRGEGKFDGEDYDPEDNEQVEAIEQGLCYIVPHVRMQMRVALMTDNMVLYEGKSPYKHNRFPLVPMWCYRRKRDNAPYGVIRDIRDPQEDYNKRASKALFALSSNRIIMDEDAVEDVEEVRAEAARPDAMLIVKKGKRFDLQPNVQIAEEHLMLMDRNKQSILDVGGAWQNVGQDESLSGKAIGKLQDQGSVTNTPLFDNRLLCLQVQSENQLSLIEQFYTAAKVVRIVGEKKPVEWLRLNQYDSEQGRYINDITRSKADYIIDEQDFKASTRQAMFESMMELVAKLPPEMGIQLLDMVIDFADVPNKEEIVARIRKINGQSDPSRKPTPEEQQALAAAQAKQQEAEAIQLDTAKATLAKLQAEVARLESDKKKVEAGALKDNTAAAYQAMQGAAIIGTNPAVAPTADAILAGAGYVDQGGGDPNIPAPAAAAPMQSEPMPMPPELQQADGAMQGIETPTPADNAPPQPPFQGE